MKQVFDMPKVSIFLNRMLYNPVGEVGMVELVPGRRGKSKSISLYKINPSTQIVDDIKIVAKLSYKTLGNKVAKSISLLDERQDFLFVYGDKTGYFNMVADVIDDYGNEQSASELSVQQFYSEVINSLKIKFILGYLASDDKTQKAEFYLRHLDNEKLMQKYKLSFDEEMFVVREFVKNATIPAKYFQSFSAELFRCVYANELNLDELSNIYGLLDTSLANTDNAKFDFTDVSKLISIIKKTTGNERERIARADVLKQQIMR